MKLADNDLPIVYSCSGCSSAAQMANQIAIKLDRTDVAEMSCIAGVGGNVKKLVKTEYLLIKKVVYFYKILFLFLNFKIN